MNSEQQRITTFRSWPSDSAVPPRTLARAGFYYIGDGKNSRVKCFSCGGEIDDWKFGQNVIGSHRDQFPDCRFTQNEDVGNIPLVPRLFIPPRPGNPGSSSATCPPDQLVERIQEALPLGATPPPLPLAKSNFHDVLPNHMMFGMEYERSRLASFDHPNWPPSCPMKPRELAGAGFFYTGSGDVVRCFVCKCYLSNWEYGDDARREHHKFEPYCDFLLNKDCGNVPCTDLVDRGPRPTGVSSEGGLEGWEIISDHSHSADPQFLVTGAKHPNMAREMARLDTFATWPANVCQTPKELAKAGFYYTGVGDNVRCYYCDCGLNQWDADDIPFVEHARWFPKCSFLQLVCGTEFIEQSQQRNPVTPELLSKIHEGMMTHRQGTPGNGPADMTSSQKRETLVQNKINELMEEAPVKSVIDMGFQRSLVHTVIRVHVEETGEGLKSTKALLDAVIAREGQLQSLRNNETHRMVQRKPQIAPPEDILNASKNPELVAGYSEIEQELEKMRDEKLCKICLDEPISVLFLPCRHLMCCPNCSDTVRQCPMCRNAIRERVKTFMS